MRIEPISAYRVRTPLALQLAQTQLDQVERAQQVAGAARGGRVCNRYRRQMAKRRVWVPTRSPRAPTYDGIEFSSIDHSPFELSMNDVDADDTDPLIIENNNAKRTQKRIREVRRWEKFRKQRKGSLKGCFRKPKQN